MAVIEKDCPGCGEHCKMTRHHIYPRRHFGNGKKNSQVFLLCQQCHCELERLIPYEVMPLEFYQAVIRVFLLIKKGE